MSVAARAGCTLAILAVLLGAPHLAFAQAKFPLSVSPAIPRAPATPPPPGFVKPSSTAPKPFLPTPAFSQQPLPPEGPPPADADFAYGAYQRGFYETALKEAKKRLETNKHDGPAMTLIGRLYELGYGVKQDNTEAAHWYALAAAEGDPQGIFALGVAKLSGQGMPKDFAGAAALFQKAAAKNVPEALYNLGMMELENRGTTPDFKKAAEYFGRAANSGVSDAAYALGLLYRTGKGVPQNDPVAARWMGRAAHDNNVPAEVEYAIMLFNGQGVAKDETAAASLFLKAAAANNPIAQNRIARLLVAGRGIKQNVVEAMKWHVLARASGEKDTWLDDKLKKLTPVQKKAVEEAVHDYVGY